MPNRFQIRAQGHHNIRSTHRTTWQLTREDHLTPRGDCIIGIQSTSSVRDLPPWLKSHLRDGGSIQFEIMVGEYHIEGRAHGHPDLTLADDVDMVFRKSEFICPRTIAIRSSVVARDLPQEMVAALGDGASLLLTIIAR